MIYRIIMKAWDSVGGRIVVPCVPQIKVSQNFLYNFAIFNKTYYVHFPLTLCANKGINLAQFLPKALAEISDSIRDGTALSLPPFFLMPRDLLL